MKKLVVSSSLASFPFVSRVADDLVFFSVFLRFINKNDIFWPFIVKLKAYTAKTKTKSTTLMLRINEIRQFNRKLLTSITSVKQLEVNVRLNSLSHNVFFPLEKSRPPNEIVFSHKNLEPETATTITTASAAATNNK